MDCYATAFGLNALNFNDYFEYCRSKNFRANHPYSASDRLREKKPNFVGFDRFDRFVEKLTNLVGISRKFSGLTPP